MSITVEMQDDVLKKFARHYVSEMEAAVRSSTGFVQGMIRSVLTQKKLVDTGHLRNSFQQKILIGKGRMLGIVGSNALHALPMDMGITKRFFPSKDMIKAITKWVKRKGIGPADEAEKIGAAISWKIAREGLDKTRFPSHYIKESRDKAAPHVFRIFERHVRRAAELASGPKRAT